MYHKTLCKRQTNGQLERLKASVAGNYALIQRYHRYQFFADTSIHELSLL